MSVWQHLQHILIHVLILSPRPLLQIRQITTRQVWLVRSDESSHSKQCSGAVIVDVELNTARHSQLPLDDAMLLLAC